MRAYVAKPARGPRGLFIVGSAELPQILGLILIATGLGWLSFLWPSLVNGLSPVVERFGFLAKLLLMF
ncbi:MAG TPA: hypothetical protein VM557_11500 [Thermoanaerobaculia bacterium]|nr:hypothetical protein [Thermoanaerobaculia bacterium]